MACFWAFSSVRLHQKQARFGFVFEVFQRTTPLFAINPSVRSLKITSFLLLRPCLADSARANPKIRSGHLPRRTSGLVAPFPHRPLLLLDHYNRLPQDPAFVKQKMRAAGAGEEGFAAKGRGNGLTKGRSEGTTSEPPQRSTRRPSARYRCLAGRPQRLDSRAPQGHTDFHGAGA